MKLNILFKNLAFLKVEFDILQPKLGICSYINENKTQHLTIWEVDTHDINLQQPIIVDCLILKTKKGYHFYYPMILPTRLYFDFLFDMVKKGLCDADFFFYSFKRGFSTLRISGDDLKIVHKPHEIDMRFIINAMKEMPIIKYYKRKYDFMAKNFMLGKEWYDIRIPINDIRTNP